MKFSIEAKNKKQFNYGMHKANDVKDLANLLEDMATSAGAQEVSFTADYHGNPVKYSLQPEKNNK